MDAVMIEVRRVVGRENSNSQMTSLLSFACGCDVGQRISVWRNRKGTEGREALLASFGVAGVLLLLLVVVVDFSWSFFSADEIEEGSGGDCSERRGARGRVAM